MIGIASIDDIQFINFRSVKLCNGVYFPLFEMIIVISLRFG